jgi:hypothetical protein
MTTFESQPYKNKELFNDNQFFDDCHFSVLSYLSMTKLTSSQLVSSHSRRQL